MTHIESVPPPLVGLCTGPHLHDFYMPLDPGESTVCPQCERAMAVYVAGADLARVADALRALRAVALDDTTTLVHPESGARIPITTPAERLSVIAGGLDAVIRDLDPGGSSS